MGQSDSRGNGAREDYFCASRPRLWKAGTSLAALMLRCNIGSMSDNRIAAIALDDATIRARGEVVEREREEALRALAEESCFVPCCAAKAGHAGPWSLRLSVPDARLCIEIADHAGREVGTIALGLARFRRVVREYFAICDSYYRALRHASASELETVDMARRAIHDRGARQLVEALAGKVETDFATARRLFTLICVLHIRG